MIRFILAGLAVLTLSACAHHPGFCSGSKAHPRYDDPYLRQYIAKGNTPADARVELSDNRTNSCD